MGFLTIPPVLTQRLDWTIKYAPMQPSQVVYLLQRHVSAVRYCDDLGRGIYGHLGGLDALQYRPAEQVRLIIDIRADMGAHRRALTFFHEIGHGLYDSAFQRDQSLRQRDSGKYEPRVYETATMQLERLLDREARRFILTNHAFSETLMQRLETYARVEGVWSPTKRKFVDFIDVVDRANLAIIAQSFEAEGIRPSLELSVTH